MTRKIAMTIIRTVLAMLNCGVSYSKIRHYTGASNGFINKLASAARSDLEAFLKLSDGEIYERVYPKTPNSHCEPNWEVVNDLLQKKHMTLQLVYDEYCRMNAGQKTYSYSSFCRRYADKKPNWEPQDLFTNLHYVTGDVMEIDFALVLVTLSTIPREPCRKVKVFDEVMHVVGQSGSSHVVVRICLRSSLDFSERRDVVVHDFSCRIFAFLQGVTPCFADTMHISGGDKVAQPGAHVHPVEFASLHQRISSHHGFGSAERLHKIDVLAQHCYRAYSPFDDIR